MTQSCRFCVWSLSVREGNLHNLRKNEWRCVVVLGGMVLVVDVTWTQALAAADSDNTVNGPSESDLRKKVRPAAGAVGTNGSLSHRVWCRMRSWRPLRRSLQLSSERWRLCRLKWTSNETNVCDLKASLPRLRPPLLYKSDSAEATN